MAVRINSFGTLDYVVFVAMLLVSMGIGVYFAFVGRKQNNQGEYLMAGRSMSIVPIAISILVSFMSAILILGTPAEMYTQGMAYFILSFGVCLGILLAALFFVPLLYPLKTTSAFQYLEMRFNSRAARLTGTCLMIISQVIYMGIASYAPSTALQAVTGFPVWTTILIIGIVATFYTSIGGMKAVVWSDVFQSLVMVAGVLAIVIQGSIKVGGIREVWQINSDWKRTHFKDYFSPDPTVRHTFWGLIFGSAFSWLGTYGINQASVQRYCSLPTLRKAQVSVMMNMVGIIFLFAMTCLAGVVVFAYYVQQDCDPLGRRLIDNPNQIIPFFVMETLSYPAIPGIFISSLFSGALSSVSSSLNALAAITWEDILKPRLDTKISEAQKTLLTKLLVLAFGGLAVGMSFITQNLEGTVLQAAISLIGTAGAPLTGMFILGAFFPWANAKGAIGGAVIGVALSLWFSIGSYVVGIPRDAFPFPNGTCSAYLTNETTTSMMTTTTTTMMTSAMTSSLTTSETTISHERTDFQRMFSLSYLWFSPLGTFSTVVFGLIISFITGANSIDDVPLKYQIPLASRIMCCLPQSWIRVLQCNRDFPDPESIRSEEKDVEFDVFPPEGDDQEAKNVEFDNKAFEHEEYKPQQRFDDGPPAYKASSVDTGR